MTRNTGQSVAELRRESERTRTELSQTVEALRDKVSDTAADIRHMVSPENIKAEVTGFAAEKSRRWLGALKDQAIQNPMQALAAGTAIAVPAFKIARSIPLPLLMIGAGLALTSPRVRDVVSDNVSGSMDAARNQWQAAKERVEGAIDDVRDTVASAAADVSDTAARMENDARQQATELGEAARTSLHSASESVGPKVSAASDAVKDAFEKTRVRSTEAMKASRITAENVVRNNSALVGGLGLAIGALIAASLPTSRAEKVTLGGTSDALRRKTAAVASGKFDEAKTAAMSAAEAAAEKVAEAGLGARISGTTEDVAEQLKTVADETITTAFEPSPSNHR